MIDSILVLESEWEKTSLNEVSVKKFFDGFTDLYEISFYYKPFHDVKDIEHWLNVYDRLRKKNKLLYIAAHGERGRLEVIHKSINISTLQRVIKKHKSIRYLMLGSCLIGHKNNIEKFLKQNKNLVWVAGYDKRINWIDSTVYDILFLSRLLTKEDRKKFHTAVNKLVNKELTDFVRSLGFNFAYRYGQSIRFLDEKEEYSLYYVRKNLWEQE